MKSQIRWIKYWIIKYYNNCLKRMTFFFELQLTVSGFLIRFIVKSKPSTNKFKFILWIFLEDSGGRLMNDFFLKKKRGLWRYYCFVKFLLNAFDFVFSNRRKVKTFLFRFLEYPNFNSEINKIRKDTSPKNKRKVIISD